MKLIFAQGNPGKNYQATRHNIGFSMLDTYASKQGVAFNTKTKFHAEIAEFSIGEEKILLAKPTTYYNETGQAARALVDFYKLTPQEDFLAVYDDLALPFGTIRTRESGGSAGNNGIKSLNAAFGEHYSRIRIGIYNELRDQIPDADFVLASFTEKEKNAMSDVYTLVAGFIDEFIEGRFTPTKRSI